MIDPTKAGAVRRRAWPAFSPCPLRKDGPKAAGNRDRAAKRVLPPKRWKRSHSSKRSRCGTGRMRRCRCFPRSRTRAAGSGPFAQRAGSPEGAKTALHRRSIRARCHTPKGRFPRHTSEDAAHTALQFRKSPRRAAAARPAGTVPLAAAPNGGGFRGKRPKNSAYTLRCTVKGL